MELHIGFLTFLLSKFRTVDWHSTDCINLRLTIMRSLWADHHIGSRVGLLAILGNGRVDEVLLHVLLGDIRVEFFSLANRSVTVLNLTVKLLVG